MTREGCASALKHRWVAKDVRELGLRRHGRGQGAAANPRVREVAKATLEWLRRVRTKLIAMGAQQFQNTASRVLLSLRSFHVEPKCKC